MSRVAFLILGIGPLQGGGGAERFFADLYDQYTTEKKKKFTLSFILDRQSVENLRSVNKLKQTRSLLLFKIWSNRYKLKLETMQLYYLIFVKNIRILHIPLYNLGYLPLLKAVNALPAFLRPRLVINIVNCYLADALMNKAHWAHDGLRKTYGPLFNEIKVDGYFCWNKSFERFAEQENPFTYHPIKVQSITSRFSDVERYFPQTKKKHLVFASRLDEQKHADWFVNALGLMQKECPALMNGWNFSIYGDGPLKAKLNDLCKELGLEDKLNFSVEGEMDKVLNHSLIYISCQDTDNFPSLTMAEAMASGNAIIARKVGQSDLFLKQGINGLFIEPDSPEGLALAIKELLFDEARIHSMGRESADLINNTHTFQNFKTQIEEFWSHLLVV